MTAWIYMKQQMNMFNSREGKRLADCLQGRWRFSFFLFLLLNLFFEEAVCRF